MHVRSAHARIDDWNINKMLKKVNFLLKSVDKWVRIGYIQKRSRQGNTTIFEQFWNYLKKIKKSCWQRFLNVYNVAYRFGKDNRKKQVLRLVMMK